ncbi:hypothetical protein DRP04_08460 [Archaeoglobales archaeon]|nr:MAG: hypothetical protein DRP04_08460 [Archaeoglobales archaeon]
MGNLTLNIQEVYSAQELVEKIIRGLFEIDVPDENYYIFSDDDQFYLVIFIPELEEEKKEIIESIGFESLEENLWIFKKPEISLNELKECLLPKLIELQKYYWKQLNEKFNRINERFHRICGVPLFPVTYQKFELPLKWNERLTLREEEFIVFIQDMSILFREGFREFFGQECGRRVLEHLSRYGFINTLGSLRNYYGSTHDRSTWDPRYIDRARDHLARLSGSEYPSEWYHFIKAQLSILSEGSEFLEVLEEEGLDELCRFIRNLGET